MSVTCEKNIYKDIEKRKKLSPREKVEMLKYLGYYSSDVDHLEERITKAEK